MQVGLEIADMSGIWLNYLCLLYILSSVRVLCPCMLVEIIEK